MNSKMSILIFFLRSVMQPKKERKKRKKKLNDISIRLQLQINSAVLPLVPSVYVAPVFRLWKKSLDFCSDILILLWNINTSIPSIAQLVERRTVVIKMSSLGRWFKSGSKEFLLFFKENC